MLASFGLFSVWSRPSTVPLGSLAKAASVGAKTVKGPLPLRVSARPAAVKAAHKVPKAFGGQGGLNKVRHNLFFVFRLQLALFSRPAHHGSGLTMSTICLNIFSAAETTV